MRNLVDDVNADSADLDVRGDRKVRGPGGLVVIAADRECGSHVTQTIQQLWIADVARVNDDIGSAERRERLGPKQSVGIRDHPDPDRRSAAPYERAPHRG